MNIITGNITSQNYKIAIIISRFNEFINEKLLSGAIDILIRIGNMEKKNITIIKVPGAYEIPIVAETIAKKNKHHGIITIGTIIKGETIHFEHLTSSITHNILNISVKNNIPIALGILMTNNIEQAINRSGNKLGNKGSEAATTILEMINIIKKI
ncbi:6,7-dimethyl-8-ribityllumazine synthase [Buchnera aphidicola]|uniref:6,7-dimethyl-8-ribityllumazine synthase n=1 Tax=Buchnera aphidicola TaxID=9 RepID=UPI0031B80DA6